MLILCPFPQGVAAGQRFKYEQYIDRWRAEGWSVTVSSYMDLALWEAAYRPGGIGAKALGVARGHLRRLRDMLRLRRYDLVYVFMWVTPFGTTGLERLTRRLARVLVYDVEDNVLGARPPRDDHAPNPIARLLGGPRKARYLARAADAVIVASPWLAEPVRALGSRDVRCIPPSLDTGVIRPGRSPVAAAPDRAGAVVIGWTGTFSSRVYLDALGPTLQRLAERVPFRLRVIGNFEYALPGVAVDSVRWTAAREAADLQAIDIGLYPLPDDIWTRGKAGLKIIQYQAAGLPCVASDVPLSRAQIRHGETGFLAASEADWIDQLERLVRDAGLRARIGQAARAAAVACYAREVVGPAYAALFADVLARARA